MASPVSHDYSSATPDAPDTIEYLPICRMAVVACVLGCLSVFALLGRFFWIVPITSLVLSILAQLQMKRAPEPMAGRRAVILGVFAALFFGGWAVSNFYFWRNWLGSEAEKNLLAWSELMAEERFEDAFQLTLPKLRRGELPLSPPNHSGQGGANPHNAFPLEDFLNRDSTKLIRRAGPNAKWRIEKLLSIESYGKSEMISLRVVLQWTEQGQAESAPLFVVMERDRDHAFLGEAFWRVEKVEKYAQGHRN